MKDKPADDPLALPALDNETLNRLDASIDRWTAIPRLRKYLIARLEAYHNRRDGHKWPWTEEPIVQSHRFTNVFREYDRETQNLLRLVHERPLAFRDKLLNCLMFRLWNRGDVFNKFGPFIFDDFSAENVRKLFTVLAQIEYDFSQDSWFTDAFMVSGVTLAARKWCRLNSFPETTATSVLAYGRQFVQIPESSWGHSPQQDFEMLRSIPGLGDFLAYQIWVDWTYIQEYPFSENYFVVAGSGCQKGLKLIFNPWPKGVSYAAALWYLVKFQEALLGIPARLFRERQADEQFINLMAMENVMCEFSKYNRLVEGEIIKSRKPLVVPSLLKE